MVFQSSSFFFELSCKGYYDTLALANRSTYKKVYFIYGSTSCGKSTLIRALFPAYKNCFFFADSERWYGNGYNCEQVGLFDDVPLPSISIFLRMTNPQPFNFDVKGGSVANCLNTIIILSNLSPEQYFDISRLDYKQAQAVRRRITHTWYFDTPLPEDYLFENDKDLSIYLSDDTRRLAYFTIRKEIQK
ncbi:RNA helicase domain-containing protein [Bifidobacteriaceae bacterium NR047]|nr:RNA helicase domain-containing protein [Bifidobacteriaceae bacterium NR047]MDZ7550112.1 RNA helicase domain-containing protein [Bifidobacteriaceae bacterium NR047]